VKKKLYYKVVEKISDNSFGSAMFYNLPAKFRLSYKIGEKTKAKIGRIFIFNNIENAKYFMRFNLRKNGGNLDNPYILAGFAYNVGKPTYLAGASWNSERKCREFNCESFYKIRRKKQFFHSESFYDVIREAPFGTLSCSSFMPIENLSKEK